MLLFTMENDDFRKGTGAAKECKKVPLGGLWGSFGGDVGALWGPLGSLWALPTPPWHPLWASLESLGSPWARSGGSSVHLGPSLSPASLLGPILASQRRLGAPFWAPNWSQRGARKASICKTSSYQTQRAQPMQRPHYRSVKLTFIFHIPAWRNAQSD